MSFCEDILFVNLMDRIINFEKEYVKFKKFETISIEMNFTYQYAVELHGYALEDFQITYANQLKPISFIL